MRGQILGVDTRTGEGQLAGDDGRRYTFRPEDWAHRAGGPAIGLAVDFDPDGSAARSLFPLPGGAVTSAPPPPLINDRSKYVAALLAFFLGTLGIDRFYLGRNGSGIAMLVLTLTVVGVAVTGLVSLIDTVRYLVMSDAEFAARYARR